MLDRKLKNSDLDKFILDNTYIETAIFGLYKINLINLINNKASLAKNFHIQPSELDKMPMWEYELFMRALNEQIKSENEEQQKEMSKYDIDKYKKMSDPSRISQPKIPSMPSMPKL